ncbi:hypothetical protein NDU88_000179 [Pleurodeles waltl]|uniref:Uncharacterized protein n=1 Tax=Pleurodeles waltl TaxID=8319 RepID=A0AAV7S3U2_PLEWA|nr:hypothetical protein NDU88_000179 [Pleurodeles waltl]
MRRVDALPSCLEDSPCTHSSLLSWRRVYTLCFVRERECRLTPTQLSVVLETRLHLALCARARFQFLRSVKPKIENPQSWLKTHRRFRAEIVFIRS